MLYRTLRPSVDNLNGFIATLEQYFKGDKGGEWVVSAFETLSNIMEHNFYGKKIPSLSVSQLKRESKKHHKHKIFVKISTQSLTQNKASGLHTSRTPKRFALRCVFVPIFTPQILLSPRLYKNMESKSRAKSSQAPRYKFCRSFSQNGRGMRIIYRFCTLRLVRITPKKYCITLKGYE